MRTNMTLIKKKWGVEIYGRVPKKESQENLTLSHTEGMRGVQKKKGANKLPNDFVRVDDRKGIVKRETA